jgi:tetratricopeptide (TPR) repeat protein
MRLPVAHPRSDLHYSRAVAPLFSSFRSRRRARLAHEAFVATGYAAAAAVLDEASALGAEAWARFAVELYNADHVAESERAIRRALELEPGRGDALIFLAARLVEAERLDEAIETYRALMARYPRAATQAVALARLLAARDDHPGVKATLAPFTSHPSPELHLLLARSLFELGENQQVVDLLAPAIQQMKLELQGFLHQDSRRALGDSYEEARLLHDDAYAAMHGREQVIETAGARGDLDARAGVNYKLLGEARMTLPPRWEADTRLRSVEEGLAFGAELVASGQRSRGLCHTALARLRQGRIEDAQDLFGEARDADDDNFAAYLGLGAAMDLASARAFERVAELPEASPPPLIESVIVDWPALTPLERKAVALLAAPLAGLLPSVVAAGGRARLLPVDARLSELPEMAEDADERHDDHRCLKAITGAATARVSASKIEELLDFTGERASVFAHELAHLAHFHAPDYVCERIEDLYERALEHEHIITVYQTRNSAEFFAVAFTDYLAETYGLVSRRELDDEGVLEETFSLIDDLRGEPPT